MMVKSCSSPSKAARGKSRSTGAMERSIRLALETMRTFVMNTARVASIPSKSTVRSQNGVATSSTMMMTVTTPITVAN